jgi:3-oxocholest-4-en-26-oyl-CoA dehydrogenase alpha subunit
MRFRFTEEQDAFRRGVRDFLDRTLTDEFWQYQRTERLPGWSPEFSRAAAAEGLLAVSWPSEYGGQAQGPIEQTIYMEEMAYAGAPQEHHRRAIQQVGPSIMLFGSDDQKHKYLNDIATGEVSFAMGLSEPNAGSDLANVETSAVRDGDDFVINGVKRYTSGAHFSDLLWCVARTEPNAPKHRGISMFVVPLKAPGVEVVPLLDLQSEHHFNYVYLRDVRVPADHLVGEENRGWYLNAQTMDYERSGGAHIGSARRQTDQAIQWIKNSGVTVTEADKSRMAEIATITEIAWLLGYRVAWMRAQGLFPNHEASMVKLLTAQVRQGIPDVMVRVNGPAGLVTNGGPDDWGADYLDSASATVGQGTSEIQRNVIATRGLGLPRA